MPHQLVIVSCLDAMPPVGEWVSIYVAGFDHTWLRGRLESADLWETDTRTLDLPDRLAVADELVTHWALALPSPFDMVPEPIIVDGRAVEAHAPRRLH